MLAVVQLPRAEPCRFCLRPCWLLGPGGSVEHPCCAWWAQVAPGEGCPACRESASAERRRRPTRPTPAYWQPPPI